MVEAQLLTTVVGSYPQPDWLVDREALLNSRVPRIRVSNIWRIPATYLEEAQDDATRVAIGDFERAGVDLSPMGKSGARVIQTALPPHWKGSILSGQDK